MKLNIKHLLIICYVSLANPAYSNDNLKFDGELVRQPCVIQPGDEIITLNFGTLIDKYIYLHERTDSKSIFLHLINCDTTLAKTVHISFSGTPSPSPDLTGYLAVLIAGQSSGLAIGLENAADGKLIALNDQFSVSLNSGSSTLEFKAFIIGEPQAIAQQTIKRGEINATMSFSLTYD